MLQTLAADARGDRVSDDLLDELRSALDAGPGGGRTVAHLESARLLEARGAYARARDAMFSPNWGSDSGILYYSTMVRESARLADLAGDLEWALRMYRHWLALFDAADPEFDVLRAQVSARVAELESLAD
jgi:hypothetical protein